MEAAVGRVRGPGEASAALLGHACPERLMGQTGSAGPTPLLAFPGASRPPATPDEKRIKRAYKLTGIYDTQRTLTLCEAPVFFGRRGREPNGT